MLYVLVNLLKPVNRYDTQKCLSLFVECNSICNNMFAICLMQLHVLAGPMTRIYGAATMVGKDEMNGRINPAMEMDDDLPAAEAERNRKIVEDVKKKVAALPPTTTQGSTNF